MICDPTSLKNSKWSTDEEVEFPKTVLQSNTRHVQARPNLVPTPHHAFIPRPPYTPPIPTHIHVPRHCASVSPHVKRKGVEDSHGFWIPRRGFRIPSTGFRIFCQCSVDSRFQSLMGFRIPWSVFRIQKPRIPDSTSKISRILESTFPYMGELSMLSSERTGPKNLTIPHVDTWVRLELLKINNVRLHCGADFHQWMGYLRYPLKFEIAAVCEETETETILSTNNLRHAKYLIFVVVCLFVCWGRCCFCLILLASFSVCGNLFLCCCFFACLLVVCCCGLFVCLFFRLYANSKLTRCSL